MMMINYDENDNDADYGDNADDHEDDNELSSSFMVIMRS